MTESQLYTFRNEQTLSINPCDCVGQDTVFILNKYGPYLDKIRALLVPSLEYRVQSLLKEFVYSTNSRWAKQFPCFKKFVDAIITWKDPLNRVDDISTMEEMMKSTIKCMIKDDLVTCFLDSIILHQRLKKVCCKLDALGIEDNILRNLNVWNFVNEQDHLPNRNYLMNFNTMSMDCEMNLNTMYSCNAERSIEYNKVVEPLAKKVYDKSVEQMRPTTSEYRKHSNLDLNKNFLQQKEDNSNHYSICVATGSQNDCSTNKINKSFDEKSCITESKKIRSDLKLKIIIHKIHLEDCETFSSANVTCLPLPCKPSNLVRRIFETDPSLTESCLIVMKRKFENSMYNVCSCLNSVLEKLNINLIKALCLNCEIYPGYISFKLKANNVRKYFFVARVPICQNVHKCMIQQDFSILSSNSKSSTEINESKCFKQHKDDIFMNFNDSLHHINEETEKLGTRHSQSDRSLIKDTATDMFQNEAEDNNKKKITCMITENVSRYVQNLAIFSRNDCCKDIVEEISNMTSCVDNSEEINKEYCKVFNSIEINCDNNVEKCRKKILVSSNSITKNDTSTQLVNDAYCICSSYENFIETNNEIESIFSNEDLDNASQITCTNEHDWTCSSDKKSNLENEVCNTNRCSITSFVQNSEYDKQTVELNYNHFSNNNIDTIDKHFDTQGNDSSLNSAKVEIGCNSCCSCQCDDFINTTVTDNIPKENIVCAFEASQNNFDAKARNTDNFKQMSSEINNLLTISVQMPGSRTSSKRINVDTCYPRTVWLTSEDDKSISIMETSDGCNEIANLSTHTLVVSKKGNKILPDINKKILNVKDETPDFITSLERFSVSKGKFRSNEDSKSFDISTEEYLHSKNHSTCATSDASLYCRSLATTSEFVMSDRRDEFQTSKLRGCMGSGNSIRNTTLTTIKHRTASHRYPNDYPAEIRPQTVLAMTKFCNSVNKSINRIKYLIHVKLGKILFYNKISKSNNMTKFLGKNEESSEDIRKKKTSDKRIRKGYSITSCSTCNYRRQSYTTSPKSLNVSIHRTKRKRKCDENIKIRDYRLDDDNKASINFHSIKISPWSYDLLTSTTENIEKQKLNNRNNRMRYDRKKKIGNILNYNRNSHRCNLKNSETSIMIVSQSTTVSRTENDSKYFGHYTCKRQKQICDNKRIYKQMHNKDPHEQMHNKDPREQMRHEYEQFGKENEYRDVSIKYSNINGNESSKISLSRTWRRNARNIHKQLYDTSELNNVKKFACLRKNRQIFENDISDHSDDSLRFNDNLYRRHIFAILTDAYNNYMDDLDLDFKLRLLRYVKLCKNIKRSLLRTLQPDDIYEHGTDNNL